MYLVGSRGRSQDTSTAVGPRATACTFNGLISIINITNINIHWSMTMIYTNLQNCWDTIGHAVMAVGDLTGGTKFKSGLIGQAGFLGSQKA